MTETDLQVLLPFLCNHRIKGQSEVRIDALLRMYLSSSMLCCVASSCDYLNCNKIIRKMDILYQIMDRTSVNGLCRMYRLVKESAWGVYGKKDEECSGLYYRLLDSYLKDPDPGQELDVLRCIAYELGNVMGDNTELDYYPFYRAKCGQWVGELDTKGCWRRLPQEIAVRRIELLQNYSDAFRDDRFHDAVLRAYNYYKKRLVLPENAVAEQLPLLTAWYDLLRISGAFPCEHDLPKRIAGLIEGVANTVETRTDTWYLATSYAVEQCCSDIMDRVQHEIMQEAE